MITFDSAITDKLTTRFRTHPCWIFSWDLDLTWFSTCAAKLNNVPCLNTILSIGNISRVVTADDGSASVGEVELTFDDTTGAMREVLKKTNLHLRKATLQFTFVDENGDIIMNAANTQQIAPAIFTGVLKVPSAWTETSRTITLSIVSKLTVPTTIAKPASITLGSNESIVEQKEWPVCFGRSIWQLDTSLERMPIYVASATNNITAMPYLIVTSPNVVGAPDSIKGCTCVAKKLDLVDGQLIPTSDILASFQFDKNNATVGPRFILATHSSVSISQGTKIYLGYLPSNTRSWWAKWILNRYTGQYFSGTFGSGSYDFSLYIIYKKGSGYASEIHTGKPLTVLTDIIYEGYKIGTADISGNTNQYAGFRTNTDPLIFESNGPIPNYQKFEHVQASSWPTNLRIRHLLREFLTVFGGLTCADSLTTSLYDSVYPCSVTGQGGIMTTTGVNPIDIARQACLELGVSMFEEATGEVSIRPLKYSTTDWTLTYSIIKLGSIKISETSENELQTKFILNSRANQIYNVSDDPEAALSLGGADHLTYKYQYNVATYGVKERTIDCVTAAYIETIHENAVKHLGYLRANRWLQLEVTVLKVGLKCQVFDVVQVNLPNEIPLASGVCRGRVTSVSTNPETLESTIKIELAIKSGSANSSGQYTEDAMYWNGPA